MENYYHILPLYRRVFMLKRKLEQLIDDKLFKGKAIILYGARQVGKTTLLQSYLAKYPDISVCYNCDDPVDREFLTNINSEKAKNIIYGKRLILIDEAQRVKNIGLSLKLIIDKYKDVQIIASGSSAFELSNEINEPLTGRKFEYLMYPFSISEIISEYGELEAQKKLENQIIYGMYPDIVINSSSVKESLLSLTNSYLYKDIFHWQQIRKPEVLDKLLKAIALQVGSEVSYSELAGLIGIKSDTVANYLQLLEKAYIIYRLGSFSRNLRNELKKAQKIYFWDTGVRNAIIGNFAPLDLRTDRGGLWENFLISERLKRNNNRSYFCNSFFWRTTQQQEIDYIEEYDGKLFAFEIKYSYLQKTRFPVTFLKNYKNIEKTEVITSENYLDFVL
jgi:uncharacterized protein